MRGEGLGMVRDPERSGTLESWESRLNPAIGNAVP